MQTFYSEKIWNNTNFILALGQTGVCLETHEMKIGDGHSAWSALPIFNTHFDDNEDPYTSYVADTCEECIYHLEGYCKENKTNICETFTKKENNNYGKNI
jgi:hypothetical protein